MGEDVVFKGDGDAVERASGLARSAFAIALVGFVEDMWIDGDYRVEFVFIKGDASKMLGDQFAGCSAARV